MPDTLPIANARMYSVNADVREDWRTLFRWVLDRADLRWPVVDHDAPAPLAALWARGDLGAVMMCGLPYAERLVAPQLIAAPVPAPSRYAGRAVYFTDLVVAAEAPFRTLADTFGGRVGYTLADSLSGGVALFDHLANVAPRGELPYRESVGGLVNARGVIDAIAAGRIDVGPLDSYCHDLLRAREPAFAARVRVVATTAARPIPPVVATAPLDARTVARLRSAFTAVGHAPELAALRARLLLDGFVVPRPDTYAPLARLAAAQRDTTRAVLEARPA